MGLPIRTMVLSSVAAVCVAGCVVGPDYHRPATTMPAGWVTHDASVAAHAKRTIHIGDGMIANGLHEEGTERAEGAEEVVEAGAAGKAGGNP